MGCTTPPNYYYRHHPSIPALTTTTAATTGVWNHDNDEEGGGSCEPYHIYTCSAWKHCKGHAMWLRTLQHEQAQQRVVGQIEA